MLKSRLFSRQNLLAAIVALSDFLMECIRFYNDDMTDEEASIDIDCYKTL